MRRRDFVSFIAASPFAGLLWPFAESGGAPPELTSTPEPDLSKLLPEPKSEVWEAHFYSGEKHLGRHELVHYVTSSHRDPRWSSWGVVYFVDNGSTEVNFFTRCPNVLTPPCDIEVTLEMGDLSWKISKIQMLERCFYGNYWSYSWTGGLERAVKVGWERAPSNT